MVPASCPGMCRSESLPLLRYAQSCAVPPERLFLTSWGCDLSLEISRDDSSRGSYVSVVFPWSTVVSHCNLLQCSDRSLFRDIDPLLTVHCFCWRTRFSCRAISGCVRDDLGITPAREHWQCRAISGRLRDDLGITPALEHWQRGTQAVASAGCAYVQHG